MTESITCFDRPIWTIPTLARALPGMPRHLLRVLRSATGSPVSAALRERVMLAVASENQCWYCQTAHKEFAVACGVPEPEAQDIVDGCDVGDESEVRAQQFARDLARRGFRSRDEALWRQLAEHFPADACAAIEASAHVMNFFNRFGNTFDALRARLAKRPDCSQASHLDVAIMSALFLPGAAAATPFVGLAMWRNKRR